MKNSEKRFERLADASSIKKTFQSLEHAWIHPHLVANKQEAIEIVLELIPRHSEVMTMTSVSLGELGLDKRLNDWKDYISIRWRLWDKKLDEVSKRRLGSAQDWAIWSVHAVTEDWKLIIASATWSQLPAYAYWASNVIYVISTKKIVKDLSDWLERIYEHVFPQENERAMKAYWMWSWVNKLLIINKEVVPWRIHAVFVKENLWF